MSTEIERRVGNLLNSTHKAAPANDSGASSGQGAKQPSAGLKIIKSLSDVETDLPRKGSMLS